MTTNQLIAKLYDEVYACGNEVSNFTSFLRVTCMRHSELRGQSMRDARSVLDRTVRHAAPAPAWPAHPAWLAQFLAVLGTRIAH